MAKTIYVTGAHKTGTSTMVNILNSSPNIFIAYEFFLNPKKREAFLKGIGCKEKIFVSGDLERSINNLGAYISKDKRYNVVGDKLPHLNKDLLKDIMNEQYIFMIRDVRNWPAKNSVINIYDMDKNAGDAIVKYVELFLISLLGEDRLHVKMEELFDNNRLVNKVSGFVGEKLDVSWWATVGKQKDKFKNAVKWWGGHPSSKVKPKTNDTVAKIKGHKFWDEILPTFEKYYTNPNKKFSKEELLYDLTIIRTKSNYNVKLADLFSSVKNIKIA